MSTNLAAAASMLEKNSILIAITGEGRVVYGGREVGVRWSPCGSTQVE